MGISAQPGAAVMSWVLHGNVRFIVPIAPTAHEGLYYAGNKRRDYGEVVHAGRGLYERARISAVQHNPPFQLPVQSLVRIPKAECDAKQSASLVRIPETLVCAMEFINLPTPPEQKHALEELGKSISRKFPDLKEKKMFWMRKASILKVSKVGSGGWLVRKVICAQESGGLSTWLEGDSWFSWHEGDSWSRWQEGDS
eukprot:1161628-Pelagomonas_calceolata.AAC.15